MFNLSFFQEKITGQKRIFFLLIVLLIFLALVIRAWPTTWDDSGITLAFSQNLARYGDIIPTKYSPRVEGFSSFLWMLINSLFFRIGFDANSVLFLAKFLATAFAISNIIFFWDLVKQNIKTPVYQVAGLILYSINSYTISSAVDGMETSLYAFVVFVSYYLYRKRKSSPHSLILFCIATSLLILIRHEGILFVLPFGLALLYEYRSKITREPVIYVWAIVFLVYQFWHYYFFGEILTNPMLAKRFWPYHPEFKTTIDLAIYYLTPLFEFFFRYISVFLLLIVVFIYRMFSKKHFPEIRKEPLHFLIAMVGLFILGITGANWGAAARLSYPGLPFIFLMLFALFDFDNLLLNSKTMQLFASLGFLLNAIIVIQSVSNLIPDIITLAGVERRSTSISALQLLINKPIITFAGVDMGGLLLYQGDGKKIIDLGLLCDKELAKNGYANYNNYLFVQNKPEIIEAHGMWLIPLKNSGEFALQYTPVMTLTDKNEQILYLRNDIVSELKRTHTMTYATAKFGFKDIDQPSLEELGTFLVLDIRNKQ